MWERLFGVRENETEQEVLVIVPDESQALYHENEARKCEEKLRNLIPYPATYRQAYEGSMPLIEYHRKQAQMHKSLLADKTSLS